MFKDYTLQTTWGRALVALVIGIIFASVIVAGGLLLTDGMDYWINELDLNTFFTVVYAFVVPLILWGGGVCIIGAPIWFVMHKKGYRTWMVAMLAGFVIPFAVIFLVITYYLTGFQIWPTSNEEFIFVGGGPQKDNQSVSVLAWWNYLKLAVRFGILGALTALTIWRIAYRRPHPC